MTPIKAAAGIALLAISPVFSASAAAQPAATEPAGGRVAPTFADLADLSDKAELVVRAQVRKLAPVERERAPGLRPGWGRYYVKARTQSLLTGSVPVGESLVYLVDLPLDARNDPPDLKKRDVVLFARPVRGRPGELQLVAPDAQLPWTPELEGRLRPVLSQTIAPDAPAEVTGVRELIHVPGTLRGQGETQIFLDTADDSAASITVRHEPGRPPQWGASFSELLADVGNPPREGSLAWYRLACNLPNSLPRDANLSETATARRQAEADYRMVLGELGTCRRNRS
ncbi:hypothetical protein GCM10011371_27220 [Novosphingobium marinum]|uniref:Uncharacterized protein n=1 Tax=Novosphingobium marinum TaxID=1514948 RepID=A0A7Y9XUD1_9SPHN|nr:hypothetical protein [Novosphingobium marinum]NYH94662.1 hypothetical protein [Novosphingobium marinum]GGC38383.1 hypothetical protein GCM10011371_27220 [Novosphingobium marinum]